MTRADPWFRFLSAPSMAQGHCSIQDKYGQMAIVCSQGTALAYPRYIVTFGQANAVAPLW